MLKDLLFRMRALVRRRSLEDDLDDELKFYLEHEVEKHIRAGSTPGEALRRARLELGGIEQVKEDCRSSWGVRLIDSFSNDVRYALRQVREARGVAAVATLSIALGIGGSTAFFGVAHAALIDPYPYRGVERMFHMTDLLDAKTFLEWQKLEIFDGLIATDFYNMSLSGGDLPESINAGRLSANAFEFFGVPPVIGTVFTSAGSPQGQEPEHVAVLSYGFWQSHYGGSESALGRVIELDRERYTVIGVAPPRFQWQSCDVFIPADLAFFAQPSLQIDGRLKPGVSLEQAESRALAVFRVLRPKAPPAYRVRFVSTLERARGGVEGTLLLLAIAVFVLLAVGCSNLSILLSARGMARQHELALRAAIGASRARLTMQLVTESLLLTSAGGVLGAFFAYGALAVVTRWLPRDVLPPEAALGVNAAVLMASAALVVLTGVTAGLASAIRLSLTTLHELLHGGSGRATRGSRAKWLQNFLVATQVALTVTLLAGAGAAVQSLRGLYHTTLGYNPKGILTVTVPTLEGENATYEARKAFYGRIRDQVATLPDAQFVAFSGFSPPFFGGNFITDLEGEPSDTSRRLVTQIVSGDYFQAMQIPLLRGRSWTAEEEERHANVAVINNTTAAKFWPNGNAIGEKIRFPGARGSQFVLAPPGAAPDWMEIIGVAGDVPIRGLRQPVPPAAFIPYTHLLADNWSLVVRTRGEPAALLRAVREQIHAASPGQPIGPSRSGVRTGEAILLAMGWEKDEFISLLFTVLASLSLILAAIGLYSAVSYATALRTREFGVRIALGARRTELLRLVLAPASRVVSAGIAAGLMLNFLSGKALAHWTTAPFGDPWALVSIAAIVVLAAALASAVPARRALRADPVESLKAG